MSTSKLKETLPILVKQELKKVEITEASLKKIASEAMELKLANPEDKDTYVKIEETRKGIKKLRVLIEKTYKAHRDKLNAEKNLIISDERTILELIFPSEIYLEEQASIYEKEDARKKQEAADAIAREEELRLKAITDRRNARAAEMIEMGAKPMKESGIDFYVLGEQKTYMELFLNMEEEQAQGVLNEFHEEAQKLAKIESDRMEVARKEKEELDRQKKEQADKERELQEREANIKATQFKQRIAMCNETTWNGGDLIFDGGVVATLKFIEESNDEKWLEFVEIHNANVITHAQKKEQAAKDKIRNERESQILSLGYIKQKSEYVFGKNFITISCLDLPKEQWDKTIDEAKVIKKRFDDEIAEQKRLALLPDKEKLEKFIEKSFGIQKTIEQDMGLSTDDAKSVFKLFTKDVSMALDNLAVRTKNLIK